MNRLCAILIAGVLLGIAGGAAVWFVLSGAPLPIAEETPASPDAEKPETDFRQHEPTQGNVAPARGRMPLTAAAPDKAPVASQLIRKETTAQETIDADNRSAAPAPAEINERHAVIRNNAAISTYIPPATNQRPPPPLTEERGIDDALSFALEAADPYARQGFTLREDYWGGNLPAKSPKAIVHQLFKGNDYWFWLGTDEPSARISVHIYDSDGNLAEAEAWQKALRGGVASAARVVPSKTGAYYVIVDIEKSPMQRTYWALAYGFQ